MNTVYPFSILHIELSLKSEQNTGKKNIADVALLEAK
jgi:hypothetical protein